MDEIFRITDRFLIEGRGCVYMIYLAKDSVLRMEEILFDLQGKRFRVKGFEMVRRLPGGRNGAEMPVGVMLEAMEGVEAAGNILVREVSDINFIFCNHPLYPERVDEDYESEYQEAGREHPCALFSYEDLEQGKLTLYGEKISGLTVYRGWMMKPEMYREFYRRLEAEGIFLINTPEEYEKYHLLPGWYQDFEGKTPDTVWTETPDPDEILWKAKLEAGPFIVKDYVKSRKHEWYDACYIPKLSDRDLARKIIRNFVSRQAESLVGGLVLRKYENLRQIGFHPQSGMPVSEEYRVFIYAGRVLIIDSYWTEQHEVRLSPGELEWIDAIASQIRSNFVTLDLARKADGGLIVMELGDGQVSGLQQIAAEDFYGAFWGRK